MTIGKTILLLACGCLAASHAQADARSDVLAGIQRCGVIHDDRVWLDCVYGANQPMRGQLGLSPAPEFQQRLVPPPGTIAPPLQMDASPPERTASRPGPRKKPGFFSSLLGNAAPVAVSRMAAYRYDGTGAFIVTLENGQEWHQIDAQGIKPSWGKEPSAYRVTITDGAFGTYNLRSSDSPNSYKVERLK
jgi:hypothetical protein